MKPLQPKPARQSFDGLVKSYQASLTDVRVREQTPILKAVYEFCRKPLPWEDGWTLTVFPKTNIKPLKKRK